MIREKLGTMTLSMAAPAAIILTGLAEMTRFMAVLVMISSLVQQEMTLSKAEMEMMPSKETVIAFLLICRALTTSTVE